MQHKNTLPMWQKCKSSVYQPFKRALADVNGPLWYSASPQNMAGSSVTLTQLSQADVQDLEVNLLTVPIFALAPLPASSNKRCFPFLLDFQVQCRTMGSIPCTIRVVVTKLNGGPRQTTKGFPSHIKQCEGEFFEDFLCSPQRPNKCKDCLSVQHLHCLLSFNGFSFTAVYYTLLFASSLSCNTQEVMK